jgi:hypothetical protein
MGMKFNRFDLPYSEYDHLRGVCSEGSWMFVPAGEFFGILPNGLINQTRDAFILCSGSSNNNFSVFLVNLNRVDIPAQAIDQEPYIVVFDHVTKSGIGGFIHHGQWPGRTTYPGTDFFDMVLSSGVSQHYPYLEAPIMTSGTLNELLIDSQNQAFWVAFSSLKNRTGWEDV